MSLDAPPESAVASTTSGNLEVVQNLLTEALRTLQAVSQPAAPVAKPKSKVIANPCLKPGHFTPRQVSPEVRARAERLRLKALLEPHGPNPPLTPEELSAPVNRYSIDPLTGGPDDPLPVPVRIAFEELVFALCARSEIERAVALEFILAELGKRVAGK